MLEKIKENKALKRIYKILYFLLVVIILIVLLVVILQRASNNTIALGGFRIFNVVTESMLPKYEIGDVLISKSINPNEIKIGDDITYKGEKGGFAGKIVTHQVIDIKHENGNYTYHTKGLANDEEDPIVSHNQVYGVIAYKISSLSFISKIMRNIYAFYFFVFVPMVTLIFIEIRKIIISLRNSKKEKNK